MNTLIATSRHQESHAHHHVGHLDHRWSPILTKRETAAADRLVARVFSNGVQRRASAAPP
jgi:hypothetical protein